MAFNPNSAVDRATLRGELAGDPVDVGYGAAMGVTRDAAIALLPKTASRAEELFGVFTVLTRNDLIAARRI